MYILLSGGDENSENRSHIFYEHMQTLPEPV